MKARNLTLLSLFVVAVLSGCKGDNTPREPREMLQVATFDYFAGGQYDGVYPLAALLEQADFGIGTIDGLDGEMYVKNGTASRVDDTGEVLFVEQDASVPFAMLCRFEPDTTFVFTPSGAETLYEHIDRVVGDPAQLLAVEIDGNFSSITTRSVPRQQKPFKTILEIVAQDQQVFDCGASQGAAVGYRIPDRLADVNAAGYHIHYISQDRSQGGHVLSFEPENVTVSIQKLDGIRLVWP